MWPIVLLAAVALWPRSRRQPESDGVTTERLDAVERSGVVELTFAKGHFLAPAAAAAAELAVSQSSVPRVTSSLRTREEQEVLFQRYIQGRGPLAAKPGTSFHERGLALDARGTAQWETAMIRNGFRRTVTSEPWHWEFRP